MRVPVDKIAFRLRGSNQYLTPRPGASMYVYERGTETEVDVYAASSGGSPLTQPITANDDGSFDAWITETDLAVDLYLPGDSVSATIPFGDDVEAAIAAGGGSSLEVNDGDSVTVDPVTEIEVPDGYLSDDGGGKVTITFPSDTTLASLIEAKGDLLGGTGSGTADNLGVGTNGQVLVADSGETTGLDWSDVADVLPSNSLGWVNHGATAGTARPTGAYDYYVWIGSVEPTNAINGDIWINTSP